LHKRSITFGKLLISYAEEFWNSLCWIWIFDHSARTIGQVPVAWERPPGRCKVAVFGA
jgi:hypothetical protein